MSLHPASHTCRALIPHGVDDKDIGIHREDIPEFYPSSSLTSIPLAINRHPSHGSTLSTLTGTSMHDSLFSQLSDQGSTLTDVSATDSLSQKLSEAEISTTADPAQTSTDAPSSKSGSTDAPPEISPNPATDTTREFNHPSGTVFEPCRHISAAHPKATADPISRSSTTSSDATTWLRLVRDKSDPYRNQGFAESSRSSRTLLSGVASPQRGQPRSDPGEFKSPSSCLPHVNQPGHSSYVFHGCITRRRGVH